MLIIDKTRQWLKFGKEFFPLARKAISEGVDLKEAITIGQGSNYIDSDDYLYSALGGRNTRDLAFTTFEKGVEISYDLDKKNPLAHRIVETPTEAIQGAGFTFQTEDDAVQEFLDEWFFDPITGYEREFYKEFTDNNLAGENHIPFEVSPVNGYIERAIIDVLNVKDVVKVAGNARIDDRVLLKEDELGNCRSFDITRMRQGVLSGDMYYFGFNKPINGKRSIPMLLVLLDWLDLYSQGMFNELERWSANNSYWFDVTIKGGDKNSFEEYKSQNFKGGKAPATGSLLIHNENVDNKIVSPDLKAADRKDMAKLQKEQIIDGTGLPGFFFTSEVGVNQGVAREQMRQAVWSLSVYQRRAQYMLHFMARHALEQAQRYGKMTSEGAITQATNIKFEVIPGNFFPKDLVSNSSALAQIASALLAMQSGDLISQKSAMHVITTVLKDATDYDISPSELMEEIEQEAKKKQDYSTQEIEPSKNGKVDSELNQTMNQLLLQSEDYN